MEELKKIEEITLPDRRNNHIVVINPQTGQQRNCQFEDIYRQVKSIELNETVPENVRSQFNVARNIALYSWFCYPFHMVSELKTFSTLEMALKIKLKQENNDSIGLFDLIVMSVKRNLIKDKHFSHIREHLTDPESTSYVEQLPELISNFRNDYAHGSMTLYDGPIMNLRICADFINQIFDTTKNNPVD